MHHRITPLVIASLALAACGAAQAAPSGTTSPPCATTHDGPLPHPSGSLHVGVTDLPAPAGVGHIAAFYPTSDCTGPHPAYLGAEVVRALGLDSTLLDGIVVHAYVDATPTRAEPRPVVVLTPGWTSLVGLSTSLATDLASHGYVVIAADPRLGSETTVFPDAADATRRREMLVGLLDMLEEPAIETLVGPIDRSRIAAGGHSYAGSVAFQVSQDDLRLGAVFDLDGVLHERALTSPMRAPAMIVATTEGSAGDASLDTVLRQSPNAVGVVIDHADHYDLTDVPALTAQLGELTRQLANGTIGPAAVGITNTLVRAFLDCAFGAGAARVPCDPSAALTIGTDDVRPLTATD